MILFQNLHNEETKDAMNVYVFRRLTLAYRSVGDVRAFGHRTISIK